MEGHIIIQFIFLHLETNHYLDQTLNLNLCPHTFSFGYLKIFLVSNIFYLSKIISLMFVKCKLLCGFKLRVTENKQVSLVLWLNPIHCKAKVGYLYGK